MVPGSLDGARGLITESSLALGKGQFRANAIKNINRIDCLGFPFLAYT
jgi:hypothetical protein